MAPLLGRLPIPWIAATGIACMLALMGPFDLALAVMIAAVAYLHPGEVLGLIPEIQRRGRWASSASVKRYERAAQVNARLTSMPDNVIQYLQESEREVENVNVYRRISDKLSMPAGRAKK